MRHLALALAALLSGTATAFAQRPAPVVVRPMPPTPESSVNVDLVVARLMSFDRNHDGAVAMEELPERLQPLVARAGGTGPLDEPALRRLADRPASQGTTRGFSGAGYSFGDDIGFSTRNHVEGAIDDLRLPAASKDEALRIATQFVDRMESRAAATLLRGMTPMLSAAQLTAFKSEVGKKSVEHTVATPDGNHLTVIVRVNLDAVVTRYGLTPSQSQRAHALIKAYNEQLRPGAPERDALIQQLRAVLDIEERDNLRAALERRPLVKGIVLADSFDGVKVEEFSAAPRVSVDQ